MIFLFCSHDAPYYTSLWPFTFSVRSQPRLYFNPGLFIFHPSTTPRCLLETTLLPHYSPQTRVCILLVQAKQRPLFTLRNPRDFHYKQLLLNIFIRRLIILCPSSFLGLDDIILIQRGRIAFRRYRRKFLLAISRRVRLFDSMDIDFYLKIEPYNFGYEIKKKII